MTSSITWHILREALEFFTVSSSKGRTWCGDIVKCQAHHQPVPNQILFFPKFFKKCISDKVFLKLKQSTCVLSYIDTMARDQPDQSFNLFVIHQYDSLELHNNF